MTLNGRRACRPGALSLNKLLMPDNKIQLPSSPRAAADEPRGTERKTTIQVLERMVSLLDALAQQPQAVSLKDLSQRTGLHPSTAHRILNDLGSSPCAMPSVRTTSAW